uniref:Secreted protein n=1 Tax=Parascaris univalens TaxID=6257 RepID=A0A914ZXX5_PARUN
MFKNTMWSGKSLLRLMLSTAYQLCLLTELCCLVFSAHAFAYRYTIDVTHACLHCLFPTTDLRLNLFLFKIVEENAAAESLYVADTLSMHSLYAQYQIALSVTIKRRKFFNFTAASLRVPSSRAVLLPRMLCYP